MTITISANILFELNILHHYFLNKGTQNFEDMSAEEKLKQLNNYHVLNFMEIVPTPDCRRQIKNYKLKYVPTPTGFIIAAHADSEDENKPFLPPDENLKLTFALKLKDGSFFNFSDLDLGIPRDQIFYFNNLEKTNSDNLSLSQSTPSGTPSLKYVGVDDLLKFYKNIHNHSIQSVGDSVQISLTNSHGDEVLNETVDLTDGKKTYQLDLRRIPSGKYTLKEDDGSGFTENFYLNNSTFFPGIFGLVELFGETTQQNDYAPLTASGAFKNPAPIYHFRIKNRSTIWKYIYEQNQTLGVDANVVFDKENDGVTDNEKILLTTINQPLTSNGLIEIKKGNEATDKLPNPDIKMIKPDESDDTKIYSETYL
jgi:hypothetical protein